MPAAKPGEYDAARARPAPIRVASTDPTPAALPDAPPPPPVLASVPFPPAYRPISPTTRVGALARKAAATPVEPGASDVVPVRSVVTAVSASAAPAHPEDAVPRSSDPANTMAAAPPPRRMPVSEEAVSPAAYATVAATAVARNAQPPVPGPAVQFAATASEEAAHAFWQSLVRRFPEALGQREPTVMRFEHGGTVFWRVRTEGFDSISEAQTLCARMRADRQACFVSRS
jgi:hypothetical protein